MIEKIMTNAGDYTIAIIKCVSPDGKILCDIKGIRKIMQNDAEVEISLYDRDIAVPNGLYFDLTEEEKSKSYSVIYRENELAEYSQSDVEESKLTIDTAEDAQQFISDNKLVIK